MCTIPKTWYVIFAYLNCLSWFPFFTVYLKSDKVSILFYIWRRGVPENGVKYLAECFSKKLRNRILAQLLSNFDAQKSNFVLTCTELLFIKNILWSTSDYRPSLTIFNETILYFHHWLLHVILMYYTICVSFQRFLNFHCSHHISVATLLREAFYFI